ncbi:Atu4866 domain-containing protein [Saccharomonospora sp. CUA-673]|uniref:Atu4866 domain-containing protein n=1 Tax=Saccharomonospora sp. CUA-673 TaxID=1904969 RepID=UPI0021011697|nr:Atu4866 domain-containing protein [Saccharomonospora sp. CUA-673]
MVARTDRPLLLTNATVHTFDPLIGTMHGADVLVGGGRIVGVGPGLVTAAEDDGAVVVDASDTAVLPARLDVNAAVGTAPRGTGSGTLTPGCDADIAVVPSRHAPDLAAAVHAAFVRDDLLLAVFENGRPTYWAGDHVGGVPTTPLRPEQLAVDPHRVGVWVDTEDFLHQELRADGRYDETRGGRPHAFQGRYWVDGDRIDYLDDLGFWAFGHFDGDTLHHAGYTMHRGASR